MRALRSALVALVCAVASPQGADDVQLCEARDGSESRRWGLLRTAADGAVFGDYCVPRQGDDRGSADFWCPNTCDRHDAAPFCQQRGADAPCRADARIGRLKQRCPKGALERREASHGDVCRWDDGLNWQCPADCYRARSVEQYRGPAKPYCVMRSREFPFLRELPCKSGSDGGDDDARAAAAPPGGKDDAAARGLPCVGFDAAAPCSAVATLYTLAPGGGERYLLMMASALQAAGHNVDVVVLAASGCVEEGCAAAAALALGVVIDWKRARLRVVEGWDLPVAYSVFAFMGNAKAPEARAQGHVNFFMSQFPFDLAQPLRPGHAQHLASYDAVLLNSRYSLGWYEHFISPALSALEQRALPQPQRVVLYPPVSPVPLFNGTKSDASRKPWVVLIGRIFDDRQGKKQLEAIDAFEQLCLRAPRASPAQAPQLYLVGSRHPQHVDYFDRVQKRALQVAGVHLLPDLVRERLHELLNHASVVWSLTGLVAAAPAAGGEFDDPDPADAEHFGIAVSEAMSAGCIPVLLDRGALREHVDEGAGFVGATVGDVIRLTVKVLWRTGPRAVADMRRVARRRASRFAECRFSAAFQGLFGSFAKSPALWDNFSAHVRARPAALVLAPRARYEAVIVDTRSDLLLPLIIRHNVGMLPCGWGLRVVHGPDNGLFLRDALKGVVGARFTRIRSRKVNDSQYNALLKSEWFWALFRHAEKVLVFQLDSVVIQRGSAVRAWLKYDYVGAPWTADNDVYRGRNEENVPIPALEREQRVGNGGLSLRSPRAMLAILRAHGKKSRDSEQEDVFFVRHLASMGYAVAGLEAALGFAVEVPIVELTKHFGPGEMYGEREPWGLHQSWLYTLVPRGNGYVTGPALNEPGTGAKLVEKLLDGAPQRFQRNCARQERRRPIDDKPARTQTSI